MVKCAFGQRRKTLLNSLYNQGGLGLTKQELTEAMKAVGLKEMVRGEALTLEQFGALANQIAKIKQEASMD